MLGKTIAILSLSVLCVGCSTQNRADSTINQQHVLASSYYGSQATMNNTVAPRAEDYYRVRPSAVQPVAASSYNQIMQYHLY